MRVRDSSLATVMGLPNMRVAVRVCDHGHQDRVRKRRTPAKIQQQSHYTVDYCFDERTHPRHAYQGLLETSVAEFLQGFGATVVAYGASQTGKTFTLQGQPGVTDWSEGGLIPIALHQICRHLAVVPKHKYQLRFSYCGLTPGHESQLLDLLNPEAPPVSLGSTTAAAALRQLTQRPVNGPDALAQVQRGLQLQHGSQGRGRPGSSHRSSCSSSSGVLHTMLTVRLVGAPLGAVGSQQEVLLTFVELAAPEYQDGRTAGTNSRSPPAAAARHLAMSYASLGKVLTVLRSSAPLGGEAAGGSAAAAGGGGSGGMVHVPWRDSALTRWLQEGLQQARNILLLGTVAPEPEAAADTIATLSFLSRFAASPPEAGHVISLNWAALSSPGRLPFVSAPPVHQARLTAGAAALDYAAVASSAGPGYSSPMVNHRSPSLGPAWGASSAAGGRPVDGLDAQQGAAAAGQHQLAEVRRVHHHLQQQDGDSALIAKEMQWQLAALDEEVYSASSRAGSPVQRPAQQFELPLARNVAAAVAAAVGADDAAEALAGESGQQALHNLQAAHHQQRQQHQLQGAGVGNFIPGEDDVLLYGELLEWVRLGGGGLRGESILDKLLGDLGGARAALSASIGQATGLRDSLIEAQSAIDAVHADKGALQAQVAELTGQLTAVSKSLEETAADRDLFLRRLQQLEDEQLEEGEAGHAGGGGRAGLQRAKAHAMQLSLLEGELTSLVTSNQNLRTQLEASSKQVSKLAQEKLAAEDAVAEAVQQLQAELAVMQDQMNDVRNVASSEALQREETEKQLQEAHAAVEALSTELEASMTQVQQLQQELGTEQRTLQSLAEELQDTLKGKEEAEAKLEEALQQVEMLEARGNTLQQLAEDLQDDHVKATAAMEAEAAGHQQTQLQLAGLLKLVSQFEGDLKDTLPEGWLQQLSAVADLHDIQTATTSTSSSSRNNSPSKGKRGLMAAQSMRPRSAAQAADYAAGQEEEEDKQQQQQQQQQRSGGAQQLWKWGNELVGVRDLLQGVLDVCRTAAREQAATLHKLQLAAQEVVLLEQQGEETRQLVGTQESLIKQLQGQLTSATDQETLLVEQLQLARSLQQGLSQRLAEAESAHQKAAQKLGASQAEAQHLQQQAQQLQLEVAEAREAVATLAQELQECQGLLADTREEVERQQESQKQQASTEAAERDEAVRALAAEVLQVEVARAAAEDALQHLTGELDSTLQQLEQREAVLQGVWAVLKGGTGAMPDLGAVWEPTGATHRHSSYGWHGTSPGATARVLSPFGTHQAQGLADGGRGLTTTQQQEATEEEQQLQMATPGPAGINWAGADVTRVYCLSDTSARGLSPASQRRVTEALTAASAAHAQSTGQLGASAGSPAAATGGRHQGAAGRGTHGKQGHMGTNGWEGVLNQMLDQHRRQQQHHQHASNVAAWATASGSSSTPAVIAAAAESQKQLLELQQRVSTIPDLEAAATVAGTQVKELSKELQVLASQHEQLQRRLQETEDHNELLAQECSRLQQQLSSVRLELDGLKESSSYSQLTSLSGKLAAAHAEVLQLQSQLETVQQQQQADKAALAGEKAARLVAEDAELSRAALSAQAESLRGRLESTKQQLAEQQEAQKQMQEELELMTVSRDTWRDAAKKAEGQVRDLNEGMQARTLELTRARAELLGAKDQLSALQSQLDSCMAASPHLFKPSGPLGEVAGLRELMAASAADGEGAGAEGVWGAALVARLKAAQTLRKEAESKVEALQKTLAFAEQHQLHAAERGLGSQLLLTEQLAAKSSEAVKLRVEAEQARVAAAEASSRLDQAQQELAAAATQLAQRDRSQHVAEQQLGAMSLRLQQLEGQLQQQQQQTQGTPPYQPRSVSPGRSPPLVLARWAGAHSVAAGQPAAAAASLSSWQQPGGGTDHATAAAAGSAGGQQPPGVQNDRTAAAAAAAAVAVAVAAAGGGHQPGAAPTAQQQLAAAAWPSQLPSTPPAAGTVPSAGVTNSRYGPPSSIRPPAAADYTHQAAAPGTRLHSSPAAAAAAGVVGPGRSAQPADGPASSREVGGVDTPPFTAAQLLASAGNRKPGGSPSSSTAAGSAGAVPAVGRSPGKPRQA